MELTAKINPEIKELWCNTLESDEYTQAKGRLRNTNGFCCLGVLSDLAVKAGVQEWVVDVDDGNNSYAIKEDEKTLKRGTLSYEIQYWAGLNLVGNDDPIVQWHGKSRRLSALNDEGYDFKTIAQIIREQL
jgi:hypothetical protein